MSATATDERVDLDVDLDAEVPCAAKSGCDRAGEWMPINLPCGHRGHPLCTPHKLQDQKTLAQVFALGLAAYCDTCKGNVSSFRWDPL